MKKSLPPALNWIYFIAGILALQMVGTPFTLHPDLYTSGPSWLGLDVSWQMTITYANIHDWLWGKDIVYTYGPLGYWATRIGWGVNKWVFVLTDLAIVINFFFLFKDFIKDAQDKFLAVLILVLTTLLFNTHLGSGLPWVLTGFIFYWLYKTNDNPKSAYFVVLIVLVSTSFFIKLNSGLFGIIFLLAQLVNLVLQQKISVLKSAIILLALLGAIVLGGYGLNVNLIGYVKGALHLVAGYNDIMYLDLSEHRLGFAIDLIFWSIALFYFIYFLFSVKRKMYSQAVFVGLVAFYIFLLRKQSILRCDTQHLSEFFYYFPVVFIFGSLRDEQGIIRRGWLYGSLTIILVGIFYSMPLKNPIDALANRYSSLANYFPQVKAYDDQHYQLQPAKRYIPEQIVSEIGRRTVDVFPWDSEYLIENNLNYAPRPVFQSFTAYTGYLQEVNYHAYLKNAPAFIIYDYDAIDGRYAFNDEWLANRFIVQNYTVADSFFSNDRSRLVLEIKQHVKPVVPKLIKQQTAQINQPIQTSNADVLKIELDYTLGGKWQSLWRRPAHVKISFIIENGHRFTYRTSSELLKAGVYVNKHIGNTNDFAAHLRQSGSLPRIVEVIVECDEANYNSKFNIEYYKLSE